MLLSWKRLSIGQMCRCGFTQTKQNQQVAFYESLSFRRLVQQTPSSVFWHFSRKLLFSKQWYLHCHWSGTSRLPEPIHSFTVHRKRQVIGKTRPLFLLQNHHWLHCAGVIPRHGWGFYSSQLTGDCFSEQSSLALALSWLCECTDLQSLPCVSASYSSRSLAGAWEIPAPLLHCEFISKALALDVLQVMELFSQLNSDFIIFQLMALSCYLLISL